MFADNILRNNTLPRIPVFEAEDTVYLNALPIFLLVHKIMQLFKTTILHSGTIKGCLDS